MTQVKIKLVKSLIGSKKDQIATARALGLKKIGDVTVQPNNPVNVIKATFEGLKTLRNAEQVAAMRGISKEAVTK